MTVKTAIIQPHPACRERESSVDSQTKRFVEDTFTFYVSPLSLLELSALLHLRSDSMFGALLRCCADVQKIHIITILSPKRSSY